MLLPMADWLVSSGTVRKMSSRSMASVGKIPALDKKENLNDEGKS